MSRPSSPRILSKVRHWIWSWWRSLTPAQLFVGAFLVLILFGTIGFMVLPGLYAGPR